MAAEPIRPASGARGAQADPAVLDAARDAIRVGSRSFAAAARLFAPDVRDDAMLLYAWCRHCDDAVDGQTLGGVPVDLPADAASRLDAVRALSMAALRGEPPAAPPYAAIATVAARRGLDPALPAEHLEGFAMDVAGMRFDTLDALRVYCHRVAGVVGEMMAAVMGVSDPATRARARDLGLAFQMTNIARDVVDDARTGRVYLPLRWLLEAGLPTEPAALADPSHRTRLVPVVGRLLDAAEPLYASARLGLRALPPRSAWAVGTALATYRAIGAAVRARGARAWDERVSTSAGAKLAFAAGALPEAARAWAASGAPSRRR